VTSRSANSVLKQEAAADFYCITLGAGQTLVVTSSTPGDAVGQFVNILAPALELYDSSQDQPLVLGLLLTDGRNQEMRFTAESAGTYWVRVSSVNNTRGEYVLRVGATAGNAPGSESVLTVAPSDAPVPDRLQGRRTLAAAYAAAVDSALRGFDGGLAQTDKKDKWGADAPLLDYSLLTSLPG
jgi:hypothetical protein